MDPQGTETSADELTSRSVDERIEQTIDSILRRVEELCALLAFPTESEFAQSTETSGSRRDNTSASPSRTRHDIHFLLFA